LDKIVFLLTVITEAQPSHLIIVPFPLQCDLVDLRQLSDLVVGLVSTVADVLGRDGQTLQEVGVRKHVIAQVDILILFLATELHERIQLHHGSECGWVLVLAPFKTQ